VNGIIESIALQGKLSTGIGRFRVEISCCGA
jgi:hypothetical protein